MDYHRGFIDVEVTGMEYDLVRVLHTLELEGDRAGEGEGGRIARVDVRSQIQGVE